MKALDIQTNNSNQIVDFEYGGVSYKIHLFTFKGLTFADININGDWIAYGVKCIPSSNLIRQKYLTKGGNFRWNSVDEEYPYFEKFNKSQQLIFYTDEELSNM